MCTFNHLTSIMSLLALETIPVSHKSQYGLPSWKFVLRKMNVPGKLLECPTSFVQHTEQATHRPVFYIVWTNITPIEDCEIFDVKNLDITEILYNDDELEETFVIFQQDGTTPHFHRPRLLSMSMDFYKWGDWMACSISRFGFQQFILLGTS